MAFQSSDARVALRAVCQSRHLQAGAKASYSLQQAAEPYVGKEMKNPRPFREMRDTKNLGVGAFMKDEVFRRKADGTVVALPSKSVGLERVGRTIYGQGGVKSHGAGRKKRGAASRAPTRPAEERCRREAKMKTYSCPTLQQLAIIDAEEEEERLERLSWGVSARDWEWAGYGALGYGSAMPWAGFTTSSGSDMSSAAPTPTLSPSRSTDSSRGAMDWSPHELEAALTEEMMGADRIFDLYINVDACGGHL